MPMRTKERKGEAEPLRRFPIGAEPLETGGVHFRVWAPRRQAVEVVLESGGEGNGKSLIHPLTAEGSGYFSGTVAEAGPGTLYRYRLDGDAAFPDPASRFQPDGPHGPSQVIDPDTFAWTDRDWRGPAFEGQVFYELHIGTFTPEGTWRAAAEWLPSLVELGITVLEVMPVADFSGTFGWGYDGVNLYAPTRLYGTPDDMRGFVDRAHSLGLAVILDVVYNHLGPDGNYLALYSEDYFTDRHETDWGRPINFDDENSGPVREFFAENAGYWIDEYHLDGLRLDATQNIYDDSPEHILTMIGRRAHAAARGRRILLTAENEEQQVRLIQPVERGGYGLDMIWNDDFHHSARVAATGRSEGYYTDYRGAPQEFISAAKYGFLFQGQYNTRQAKHRGTPTFGIEPSAFVTFLQNHDQVANSATGARLHQTTAPGCYRALTALFLLGPGTPLLFQGQEFAASSPFVYFADQQPELAELTFRGRKHFLSQFRSLVTHVMQERIPRPSDPATFQRSKLDQGERARHTEAMALHRDLLRLRREEPLFHVPRRGGLDGAALAGEAFVLRFFGDDGDDRLLVVNLGSDLHLNPAPEPLLAPPLGRAWGLLWSSEAPAYGGTGTPALDTEENWRIPGHAAVVLSARGEDQADV